MVKRYEELTIADDFIFGKTMGDKVLCHDMLERMLQKRVGTLVDVQPQKEFQYTVDGKPVRLDIYARDRKRIYDAEMQNRNHQSVKKLELPKRSRFYQSTMDTDHLRKGKSYRELPEGKVGGDLTRRMDEAVRRARENEEWRSEYMKELLHDDDVREEGREAGRAEGRAEGRDAGRAEERNFLLTLISRMSLGGDADKATQLGNPTVLRAMQKKYGLE